MQYRFLPGGRFEYNGYLETTMYNCTTTLFNPVTGPETRKWLKDLIGGGGGDFGGDYPSSGSNGGGREAKELEEHAAIRDRSSERFAAKAKEYRDLIAKLPANDPLRASST